MFTKTAAVVLAITLACTAAKADTNDLSNYQMPSILRMLTSGGADFGGSFNDDQFVAYALTFGMTLSQTWTGVVPAEFDTKAFSMLASVIMLGGDVNAAATAGVSDAETFVRTHDPESAQTKMVVRVLSAIAAN